MTWNRIGWFFQGLQRQSLSWSFRNDSHSGKMKSFHDIDTWFFCFHRDFFFHSLWWRQHKQLHGFWWIYWYSDSQNTWQKFCQLYSHSCLDEIVLSVLDLAMMASLRMVHTLSCIDEITYATDANCSLGQQ